MRKWWKLIVLFVMPKREKWAQLTSKMARTKMKNKLFFPPYNFNLKKDSLQKDLSKSETMVGININTFKSIRTSPRYVCFWLTMILTVHVIGCTYAYDVYPSTLFKLHFSFVTLISTLCWVGVEKKILD